MNKIKKYIIKYLLPSLLVVIFFIPFICVKLKAASTTQIIKDLYLSPFSVLFDGYKLGVISVLFLGVNVVYIVYCLIHETPKRILIRRIALLSSIIMYILIFKFTTNTNLNLFAVLINIGIAIIYIINCFKEVLQNTILLEK